jgi:hypothetical protein
MSWSLPSRAHGQPEHVQRTVPERVCAARSPAAFAKVNVPEPLALTVTEALPFVASRL